MIDDEQYSSFKFDGEGQEEPDTEETIYREEAKDRRVEKLGHRVTIISILIPVLIGVVFYIAYSDITGRVSQSQDTGAMEIQNLSSQLEENFAKLSTKYGDLETALTQKLAALEKVDKSMKDNLKKAEDTVAQINATKADKKDQQNAIAKLDKALNPLRQELKAIKSMTTDLQNQNNDLKQQMATLSANLARISTSTEKTLKESAATHTKELNTIQSELTSLSGRKMDKDALQLELLKARKYFQRDLDEAKSAIDKRLASMLRKIKDLEKVVQAPLSSARPGGQSVSSGSGGIVEQEIKE
jgi:DNA repair exonuclease SbcCD ATPase subunit